MSRSQWQEESVRFAALDGIFNSLGLVRSDIPGLAVTLERVDSGTASESWSVTHIASGMAVVKVDSCRKAMRILRLLGQTGVDWTADKETLKTVDAAVNAVRDIRQRPERAPRVRKEEK